MAFVGWVFETAMAVSKNDAQAITSWVFGIDLACASLLLCVMISLLKKCVFRSWCRLQGLNLRRSDFRA